MAILFHLHTKGDDKLAAVFKKINKNHPNRIGLGLGLNAEEKRVARLKLFKCAHVDDSR